MAHRSAEMADGSYATQGASAIFRVLGGWGNLAGPSSFMMRAIIFGSSTAVMFGITGGMAGALLYGTASLPFIAMSSMGFVLGITRWYQASVTLALLHLER